VKIKLGVAGWRCQVVQRVRQCAQLLRSNSNIMLPLSEGFAMKRRQLIGLVTVVSASLAFSGSLAATKSHSTPTSVHRQTSFPARNVVFWAIKGGIFATIASVPLSPTTNGSPQPTFAEGMLNILRKEGLEKSGYFVIDAGTGQVIFQDDNTKSVSGVDSRTP
jgi:hypothetical protein